MTLSMSVKIAVCLGTALFFLSATDFGITGSFAQKPGEYVPGGIIIDVKDGECPKSDPTLVCKDDKGNCTTDCECKQNQKCCFQESCGNICVEAIGVKPYNEECDNSEISRSKPGTCPKSLMDKVCIRCAYLCRSDCECPGEEICCKAGGCGTECSNTTESGQP